MGLLESTFNCQKCSRKLWLKYYKLSDGRIVCLKCYNFYKDIEETDNPSNRKNDVKKL